VLRADGTDTRSGSTTLISEQRETRVANASSFDAAIPAVGAVAALRAPKSR
jgi:hypothetical protein